jgi:hypothetical protein
MNEMELVNLGGAPCNHRPEVNTLAE